MQGVGVVKMLLFVQLGNLNELANMMQDVSCAYVHIYGIFYC